MKYDLLKFIKHAIFQSPIHCKDCQWYHNTKETQHPSDMRGTKELCLNPRVTKALIDRGRGNTVTIQQSREDRDLCGPSTKHFHIR